MWLHENRAEMKISYNWLKQFINIDWDAEKTGELLTDLGLEVEGIERCQSVKGGLEGVVIGEVLTCEQHPNADPLPSLIVGDFNDWRNALAAAVFQVSGFRQVTSPPSRFRSFPAWLAMGSLDKAFVRGGFVAPQGRMVRTSLAREASDHLPLVIDFGLG